MTAIHFHKRRRQETTIGAILTLILSTLLAILALLGGDSSRMAETSPDIMSTRPARTVTPATAAPPVVVTTRPPAPPTTEDVCYEDEPCWDCTTMGNLICGPVEDGR